MSFFKTLLFCIFFILISFSTQAATIQVESGGSCTPEKAIQSFIRGSDYSDCVSTGTYGVDDTLEIGSGTYCLSSALSIYNDLTVMGKSAQTTILDGGNSSSSNVSCTTSPSGQNIFSISLDGSETVTLKNMTIQGGISDLGGGIYFYSKDGDALDLEGIIVQYNETNDSSTSAAGGGLFFINPSTSSLDSSLTIKNSQFLSNKVVSTSTSTEVTGGAIKVSVSSSTVGTKASLDNVVIYGNSISASTRAKGGGLYFQGKSLNINRSAIVGNTIICDSSVSCEGGGIYDDTISREDNFILNSSIGENSITNNYTSTGYSVGARGGGIYVRDNQLYLSYTTVALNSISAETARGGGIFFTDGLRMQGLLLSGNSSIDSNTGSASDGPDCYNSGVSTTFYSGDYNWVNDTTNCPFTASTHDTTGTDPGFSSAFSTSNGGETYTLSFDTISPTPYNQGGLNCKDLNGDLVNVDQRGATRSSLCSIGALEINAPEKGDDACIDDIDNDGDGATDCDDSGCSSGCETYYLDDDGDDYGSSSSIIAYSQPEGYTDNSDDCDDTDKYVNPRQLEVCNNSKDDNCDGSMDGTDSSDTVTYYADSDGDAYGDASAPAGYCEGKEPSGYVLDSDDCDDDNALINPAATEVCDGSDNDCDRKTDEEGASGSVTYYLDSDEDSYGSTSTGLYCSGYQPANYVSNSSDCDDAASYINPSASEVCDGQDNNCDGTADEGLTVSEIKTYYEDEDVDGYGEEASARPYCEGSQPSGAVTISGECDDTRSDTNPVGTEICDDGIDQDCSGADCSGKTTSAASPTADPSKETSSSKPASGGCSLQQPYR